MTERGLLVTNAKRRKGKPVRQRLIPVVGPIVTATRKKKAFGIQMAEASRGKVVPYDLRRCFRRWLGEAGVPKDRIPYYMGHSASSVDDLYVEFHSGIEKVIESDSELLREFVGMSVSVLRMA